MGTALGVASVRMKPAALENLVDVANGLISREIFVSDEIYQQELERVFARAWLFVGHESLIPNPGDYFVSSMGEESVILTRDHHREVHVFVNTCRHRGMKVCRYDQGNTTLFTCPYHGWSYGTDGRLAGVPYFKEAYRERLDKSKWGLIEVAQLANYKGTIWATWDPQAPGFTEYLGDMRWYLDVQLDTRDGREGGSEVIGGITKWYLPCNWKFAAENFIGDFYHGISHRSGGPGQLRAQRQGARDRHGLIRPAEADRDILPARPRGRGPKRLAHRGRSALSPQLSEHAAGGRILLARLSRAAETPRWKETGAVRHRLHLPQRDAPQWRPAYRRLASTRATALGGLALLPCRQGRARGSEGRAARLLHALLGARGDDRAG